ncbi:hypothetical protein [Austwickia chelonae]|uniref:hypothetical protein n=1 Tax=Austwickia chelonae TaxID=100225 RepID=UPI0013C32902|nr:hypothetical protein [Austwickia chelonae]
MTTPTATSDSPRHDLWSHQRADPPGSSAAPALPPEGVRRVQSDHDGPFAALGIATTTSLPQSSAIL